MHVKRGRSHLRNRLLGGTLRRPACLPLNAACCSPEYFFLRVSLCTVQTGQCGSRNACMYFLSKFPGPPRPQTHQSAARIDFPLVEFLPSLPPESVNRAVFLTAEESRRRGPSGSFILVLNKQECLDGQEFSAAALVVGETDTRRPLWTRPRRRMQAGASRSWSFVHRASAPPLHAGSQPPSECPL